MRYLVFCLLAALAAGPLRAAQSNPLPVSAQGTASPDPQAVEQRYDIAAYYWPAYHPEERWNLFFIELYPPAKGAQP